MKSKEVRGSLRATMNPGTGEAVFLRPVHALCNGVWIVTVTRVFYSRRGQVRGPVKEERKGYKSSQ